MANITTAFRNTTNTEIGVWCIIPSRPDLIPVGTAKNFVFGNNIGGTAALASYSGTASNLTITSLQTGAPGSGTFTHPFNAGISYIDGTAGLLNTNTSTDNQYRANTSPSLGVGNNNGLFLTYNKTNYLNNSARSSNTQVSSNVYNPQFTDYIKRFAYRPEIITFNFSDGPQTLSKILVADIHWEDVSKTVVDAYTRTSMVNTNDVYRWIENLTDDRLLTGQTGLTSVYERFIRFDSPVDSGALIDFGAINLALNTNVSAPNYVGSSNFLTLAVQSSLNTGGTTLGFKTSGRIDLDSNIDFNEVILETSGNLELVGSNITNGIVRANTTTSTGDITGTRFEVPPGQSSYIITHSGGNFDSVLMDAGGVLNTDDQSLHGLTADNITINYQDATADFSVDSPGAITNSAFTFNSITSDIIWNIDEDLSTCSATNITSSTVTIILGPNGIPPLAANLNGNFVLSRTIIAPGSWFYRVENASTGALITENFTTPAVGSLAYNSAIPVNAYLVRTDADNFKPFIIRNEAGDPSITFESDSNLDLAIQSNASADVRALIESYVAASALAITSGILLIQIPADFTHDGDQQTTSESYWNALGGRGSGQYAMKLFERQVNYAITVLDNLTTLAGVSETQLFSMISGSRTIN